MVGRPEGKGPAGGRRCEDNIKMGLKNKDGKEWLELIRTGTSGELV